MAGIHELFYDPSNIAYDEGRWIGPIGGHSDHVHVSFAEIPAALSIIAYAQTHGLRVGENPYTDTVDFGVHTPSSYHYRNFPGKVNGRTLGMAVDVSGTPAQMAAFADWVRRSYTGGMPASSSRGSPPVSSLAGAGSPSKGSSSSAAGIGCLVPAALVVAALGGACGALIAIL